MRFQIITSAWWGPPKKFDKNYEERRVSWLELFYDLVYVIAIARITHHLAQHLSVEAFLEYGALFILIFWGWLNGSLYYDIHGNEGLRTRLMTLWQMMIIAAFSITIDQAEGKSYYGMTIVLMIMQFFITYLWWSVGFYDKSHRRYNTPYTIFYLLSFVLMALSLILSKEWLKLLVPLVLIFNYAPPFISQRLLRQSSLDLDLSHSMVERLGLFTIIVFGELVLGVVNGISDLHLTDFSTWLKFSLAVSIVFALWWIFFTLVSNRQAKRGFATATFLELLYVPTLISLGLIAASFATLFEPHSTDSPTQHLIGYAITIFLTGICLMMNFLEIPERFRSIIRPFRNSMAVTAIIFLVTTYFISHLEIQYFLIIVLLILLCEILFLNAVYYTSTVHKSLDVDDIGEEQG